MVNAKANAAVGVPKVDGMTPDDTWQKRLTYLQTMLTRILKQQTDSFSDVMRSVRAT